MNDVDFVINATRSPGSPSISAKQTHYRRMNSQLKAITGVLLYVLQLNKKEGNTATSCHPWSSYFVCYVVSTLGQHFIMLYQNTNSGGY